MNSPEKPGVRVAIGAYVFFILGVCFCCRDIKTMTKSIVVDGQCLFQLTVLHQGTKVRNTGWN